MCSRLYTIPPCPGRLWPCHPPFPLQGRPLAWEGEEAAVPPQLLRPGTKPNIALYTRCEEELLWREELLTLMERVEKDRPEDKEIAGHYDADPTFAIAEFNRGYRGREGDYNRLMAMQFRILAQDWPFLELPRPSGH